MNITEYRAMKEAETNAQTQQTATEPVQSSVQETQQTEPVQQAEGTQTTPQNSASEPTQPQLFDVGGQQVSLEELQRGYLRQSDYTRKTQEVSRQSREIESARELLQQIQSNPEIAEQLGYDPNQQYTRELESNYYDLLVQQEVSTLSTKYNDFEASEVLNFALENKMENLEHAYLLNKQYKANAPTQQNTAPQTTQPVDVEALKAQIRAELLAEQNTGTIISSSGGTAPTPQQEVQLTPEQLKIAKAFRLTPEEYIRHWG